MQPKIKIQNVNKSFGELQVLKDVNFQIYSGEKICIIGSSGSGKSTLLRCINCLEQVDNGKILIDGVDIVSAKKKQRNEMIQKIGMVFQQFNLFNNMTAIENVTFALRCNKKMKKKEAYSIGLKSLERVGLKEKCDFYPHQLSGGQKQRVAIARSLAMTPNIILFDEPTSALDPEMVNEVLSLINELAKTSITMIIVTHEMEFVKRVADRVVFFDQGTIVNYSDSESFFNNPSSERIRKFLELRQ